MIADSPEVSPNPKKTSRMGTIKTLTKREETQPEKNPPPMHKKQASDQLDWVKVIVEFGQLNEYTARMLESSSFKDSFSPTIDLTKYEEITIF